MKGAQPQSEESLGRFEDLTEDEAAKQKMSENGCAIINLLLLLLLLGLLLLLLGAVENRKVTYD